MWRNPGGIRSDNRVPEIILISRRAILPILLVASAAALLIHLYRQGQPKPAARQSSNRPEYTLENVVWNRFNKDGQPVLRGHAVQLSYFDDTHITGRGLDIEALRAHGTPWTASAPAGLVPSNSSLIELTGNVQVHGYWPNGEPLTIATSRLWINPHVHQLSTSAPVAMNSKGRHGTGTGLSANWLAQNVNLLFDVKMSYDASAKKQ